MSQQKTLLNLGASFPIPKPKWAELIETIEVKLAGNEFLFEPAPELAAAAESIVQRLRSRELEKLTDDALEGDTAHIKLDSVEMDNARSVGSERLALAFLEALGLSEVLNLNSAVGAWKYSVKLLMLIQKLCLEISTMANPFGEAL